MTENTIICGCTFMFVPIIYQVENTVWSSVKQRKTSYRLYFKYILHTGHGFISPFEMSTLRFKEIYVQYNLFSLTISIMQ